MKNYKYDNCRIATNVKGLFKPQYYYDGFFGMFFYGYKDFLTPNKNPYVFHSLEDAKTFLKIIQQPTEVHWWTAL